VILLFNQLISFLNGGYIVPSFSPIRLPSGQRAKRGRELVELCTKTDAVTFSRLLRLDWKAER
jgi:hypothetical protein